MRNTNTNKLLRYLHFDAIRHLHIPCHDRIAATTYDRAAIHNRRKSKLQKSNPCSLDYVSGNEMGTSLLCMHKKRFKSKFLRRNLKSLYFWKHILETISNCNEFLMPESMDNQHCLRREYSFIVVHLVVVRVFSRTPDDSGRRRQVRATHAGRPSDRVAEAKRQPPQNSVVVWAKWANRAEGLNGWG